MKTCEKCGASNEDDVSFCVNCGNKLANNIAAPIGHKPAGGKKCAQCGTANEPNTKFCVGCGNNLSDHHRAASANFGHAAPRQESQFPDLEMTDEMRASLQQAPNPIAIFWEKLLFPERLILIGAVIGCVAAILIGFAESGAVVMPVLYFLSMAGSLALLYISREASVIKRIDLARWQIALGAFWLAIYITNVFYSLQGTSGYYSYAGQYMLGLWLSFFSSVGILTGAIMLQGILVQHVFKRRNK